MKEKYLPIGTVVLLKEATKRLMITGYCSAKPEEPNMVYDYVGILFPEGNLAGDEVALFNHEQIGVISHMGLDDDEFRTLEKNIKKIISEESPNEQAELTPLGETVEPDLSFLSPFTPNNINNILEQIKGQEDLLMPISEPTAFNEEVIKKDAVQIPLLGKKTVNYEEKNEVVEQANFFHGLEENEVVAEGQPVLQLQPIFDNDVVSSDDSSSASGMVELSRL